MVYRFHVGYVPRWERAAVPEWADVEVEADDSVTARLVAEQMVYATGRETVAAVRV